MITDVESFFEEQQNEVARYINTNFTQVRAEDLGLDPRAGSFIYVNKEAIAVSVKYVMTLDYYAGFEYVSRSSRYESSGFVFFVREDQRVAECIDTWKESVDTELAIA